MFVEKAFWQDLQKKLLIHTEGGWVNRPVELRNGTKFEAQSFSSTPLSGIRHLGAFSIVRAGGSIRSCTIGRFTAIGQNLVCSAPEHPISDLGTSSIFLKDYSWCHGDSSDGFHSIKKSGHKLKVSSTVIGNDVWIGRDVFIKGGVRIGDGAIVAARSVVTKDIPPYSIVAGVPAKVIAHRFDDVIIQRLLEHAWWNYEPAWMENVALTDINDCLDYLDKNAASLNKLTPRAVEIKDEMATFT